MRRYISKFRNGVPEEDLKKLHAVSWGGDDDPVVFDNVDNLCEFIKLSYSYSTGLDVIVTLGDYPTKIY